MNIPQDIKNLFSSDIKIGLTGSRLFGVHTESSDYDIFIKWSPELEQHCSKIAETSKSYVLDTNTKAIYFKRINNIDYNIILVDDFSKREALDNLVMKVEKDFFKNHKKFYGTLSLKNIINFLYREIELTFESTDSQEIVKPSSIDDYLPF